MPRGYALADLELLWGRAALRCAFPECRRELAAPETEHDPTALLGEIAHIVSRSDAGPRADPGTPLEDRNRYDNLILLCPTHHTLVDRQDSTYTAETLRALKREHEEWVRAELTAGMHGVGFAELQVAARGIARRAMEPVSEFAVTPPLQKMQRNALTDRVIDLVYLGAMRARDVAEFVEGMTAVSHDFPERLKAGFVEEYNARRNEGLHGDSLFEALRLFAAGDSRDLREQAAGLAILVYLFEKCEVFEP